MAALSPSLSAAASVPAGTHSPPSALPGQGEADQARPQGPPLQTLSDKPIPFCKELVQRASAPSTEQLLVIAGEGGLRIVGEGGEALCILMIVVALPLPLALEGRNWGRQALIPISLSEELSLLRKGSWLIEADTGEAEPLLRSNRQAGRPNRRKGQVAKALCRLTCVRWERGGEETEQPSPDFL